MSCVKRFSGGVLGLSLVVTALGYGAPAHAAPTFEGHILDLHNGERALHGVEPLAWDFGLARDADVYAAELAKRQVFKHSESAGRSGQGENLWMGTKGAFGLTQMVGGWLSERNQFRPGVFPDVARYGSWHDVGHYSQIMWRSTKRVGCAVRSSGRDDYLVCRYSPAGNVMTMKVF